MVLKMKDNSVFSYAKFEEVFSDDALKKQRESKKKLPEILEGNYIATINPKNKDFVMLASLADYEPVKGEGEIFKDYGLKFHISLPENNKEMYAKGWQIVRDSLIEAKVNSFKI